MAAPPTAIRFVLADPSHDAGMRVLLRQSAMRGGLRLSLQREPGYFEAASVEGDDHQAVLALHGDRVICMGGVSTRERFFNGKVVRLGYLGGLRLHPEFRGRVDILRRGYQMFRQLHEASPPSAYLTSIGADNLPAIRLLERGAPGFPEYRHAGDLATIAMGVRPALSRNMRQALLSRSLEVRQGTPESSDAILEFLEGHNAQYQFSPRWTRAEFDRLGARYSLRPEAFRLLLEGGRLVGCAAIWDQRDFKQAVVMGYSPAMSLARPLYNIAARLRGRVLLPPPGRMLSQVYVSHLGLPGHDPELLCGMLSALMPAAHDRGARMMLLAMDAKDPRLAAVVRRFGAYVYRTRLYLVRWPDQPNALEPSDGRLILPEAGLL